ncbi:MAG: hypothetical protein ACK4SZ_13735 [Allosphingosinicella sp.]|uniref:hypothetical protein n=1 Tax=Allosphingosinicella sp. TaxID=2823234 RepID=UPI0039352060
MTNPHFDPSSLHPNAAAAIDADGRALVEARQVGTITCGKSVFESRRETNAEITDADLAGEPLLAWSNLAGEIVGRYFPRNGQMVALREDGYRQLRRLVEKVGAAKPFSSGFSDQFLEVEIFKWWRTTVRAGEAVSLSAHLLVVCAEAISARTLLVPLSNLEIERPFRFGDVLVTPIGARLFDDFGADGAARFPDAASQIREEALRMRREYGHLTAVCVEVVGEREFANQRARVIAADMADFFRFMSPAAASRSIVFACFPYGAEHEPTSTVIEVADGKIAHFTSGMVNAGFFRWKLSFQELDGHMNDGFRNCAVFFSDKILTGFQRRVKTAISAYTHGIAATDVRNRLIYAMSAAEHLLLRDGNEPIQSNVGERMAFLISRTAEERFAIATNFKKAYGLRSRHIHHLSTIDNDDVLDKFFEHMFLMLTAAMDNMQRYKEHLDFLDALDRIKFS